MDFPSLFVCELAKVFVLPGAVVWLFLLCLLLKRPRICNNCSDKLIAKVRVSQLNGNASK